MNRWKKKKARPKKTPPKKPQHNPVNQKILENITDLQEENFLTEFLASLAPRDIEVQTKEFKAEDLHVPNDITSLLWSDLWLKNNAHGLVNHVTLWFICCSKLSMMMNCHVTGAWESKSTSWDVSEGMCIRRDVYQRGKR